MRRGSFWISEEASEVFKVRFFLVFKSLHLIRLSHLTVMLSDGIASFYQSHLPVLALPHTIMQPQEFLKHCSLKASNLWFFNFCLASRSSSLRCSTTGLCGGAEAWDVEVHVEGGEREQDESDN